MERRTAEEEVRLPILEILSSGNVMTTHEIRRLVKARMLLSISDRLQHGSREGEARVDSIVANALQAGRHLCTSGQIERVGRDRFRIAAAGIDAVGKQRELNQILQETFPDGLD